MSLQEQAIKCAGKDLYADVYPSALQAYLGGLN